MGDKKRYFHNFNGLRFYLASYVLFFHIEELKYALKLPSLYNKFKFLEPLGTSGITLFFTMSGFLISYFLFNEKMRNTEGRINMPKFYKSRILRIWPLYFLCLIIYWFLAPHSFLANEMNKIYFVPVYPAVLTYTHSKITFLFPYLILLPQLSVALSIGLYGFSAYAGHFWSIGTEEMFYFYWPIVVNGIKRFKNIFIVGFGIAYVFHVILFILLTTNRFFFHSKMLSYISLSLIAFIYLTRLYCIIIGCLFSYFYIVNHRYLQFFRKKGVVVFAVISLIIMIGMGLDFPFFIHEIYALQWSVILVFLTKSDLNFKILDNKLVSYLGKITYGFYMYHIIIIILVIYIAQQLTITSTVYFNIFTYIISYFLTILVSHISYKYFESYFLKLK